MTARSELNPTRGLCYTKLYHKSVPRTFPTDLQIICTILYLPPNSTPPLVQPSAFPLDRSLRLTRSGKPVPNSAFFWFPCAPSRAVIAPEPPQHLPVPPRETLPDPLSTASATVLTHSRKSLSTFSKQSIDCSSPSTLDRLE